ncbi:hypothetical protein [Ferruginibacter sp.]|uniref:hypothetical protein n=1 Tax=Ferruginibacter sp. TaxID=1940288 RepID=UPI0026595DCE|nr:hypothetical protein [Ferruginibacter sp.]
MTLLTSVSGLASEREGAEFTLSYWDYINEAWDKLNLSKIFLIAKVLLSAQPAVQ